MSYPGKWKSFTQVLGFTCKTLVRSSKKVLTGLSDGSFISENIIALVLGRALVQDKYLREFLTEHLFPDILFVLVLTEHLFPDKLFTIILTEHMCPSKLLPLVLTEKLFPGELFVLVLARGLAQDRSI